ncbi:MAG: hypothetical protein Kow0029_31980 [Candidatus Rifleibacteriota bacterium]
MSNLERYEKQTLFSKIGISGQKKLLSSRVGILGCGALGTNLANILCRSGVGEIIIADRDRVELSNLQRQMLFNENDVGLPKAIRAARRLCKINSDIKIEGFFQSVDRSNFRQIFSECDLIFDATDNFPARFMLNEACLESGIPWVHSAVTASCGQSMLFIPGKTACFGCLVPEYTESESFPTVHNSGILTSTVTALTSISALTGMRFLIEKKADPVMIFLDIWETRIDKMKVKTDESCKYCRHPKLRRK